ncbi:MAG: tRNA lysidine(34) synthetase TilS [Proteobacteria bacterium]|nr:tRNA lysidine(34) synthetase TilS [Pseudomonadota bacterium]
MARLLDSLGRSLAELPGAPRNFAVAFSGGADSTVLLAAICRLTPRPEVRALHVDHGLHPDSKTWERRCRAAAAALGVGYRSLRCPVEAVPGESLEARAREVRYRALTELLAPGETLLTAHHADDQLETVLLRLLRGTGVRGLRGIAPLHPFGAGFLARPLLGMSRAEILAAARDWGLEWIEDPSNRDTRFDRNYVRAELIPRITERWPAAARTVGRAASQMAQAQQILDEAALADAPGDPERIECTVLRDLSPVRRRNVLRHSMVRLGLPMPDTRQMDELLRALDVRRRDAKTTVQWPGGEARIYRDRLYLLEPLPAASPPGYSGKVSLARPWSGPEGKIRLVASAGHGLPANWAEEGFSVRFRKGGERFRPIGRPHSRPLKKWLQEAGVPPWLRARIPLLYREDALVAVGDLWVAHSAADRAGNRAPWQVRWTDHPRLS